MVPQAVANGGVLVRNYDHRTHGVASGAAAAGENALGCKRLNVFHSPVVTVHDRPCPFFGEKFLNGGFDARSGLLDN
jgi:hypothetical protein